VPARGRRPSGGADVREAILASARRLISEVGFERASMRAIASDAGVDPALIYHYVGAKDDLLVAALVPPVDPAQLLAGVDAIPDRTGEELVRRVLNVWESDPEARRSIVATMRAGLSNERAAQALRDALGSTILAALRRVVAPDHEALRAELVGSQIAGLILGRYVLGLNALTSSPPETLATALGPAVQRYLTGDLGPADAAGSGREVSGPGL
jgi:AcrR family transcriptional regulator